ncbi:hypothetical protein FI667_g5966, partial [Globisporangium splendens]
MAIAYFLDKTKSLSGFVEDDIVDIINCAVMMADRFGLLPNITGRDFHNQLVAFGLAKRSWSTDEKLKHAQFSPLDWWSLTNRFKGVKEFATRILSIPTSSAASERSWSIHGFIHSKNRNRLTPARVDKLVFVYSNLGKNGAVDHILYELFPEAEYEAESEVHNPLRLGATPQRRALEQVNFEDFRQRNCTFPARLRGKVLSCTPGNLRKRREITEQH